MRVLETSQSPVEMPGKRTRKPKMKEKELSLAKSGDDGDGFDTDPCRHISKSVNLNTVKKHMQSSYAARCEKCKEPASDGLGAEADLGVDPSLWLCLQCGHLGCGRSTKHQHALEHVKVRHSDPHDLCLNTTSGVIWCYNCDNEVTKEASKKLGECVDYVQKYTTSWGQRGEHGVKSPHGRGDATGKKTPQATSPVDADGPGDVCGAVTTITETETINNHMKKNKTSAALPGNGIKVKGLRNLGNTCFFNAVMQNLSHTSGLEKILATYTKEGHVVQLAGQYSDAKCYHGDEMMEDKVPTSLPIIELKLSDGGAMTACLHHFLEEMKGSQHGFINPTGLFHQVCKKAPRFKGFQQQDSHELLRQLLDGIKSEEIKRSKEAILKCHGVATDSSIKNLDEDTKLKIREYGRQAKHTFVDSMFGGHLISTVLCEECHTPSQIFEPFLDLSLPIVEEKTIHRNSGKDYGNNGLEAFNAQQLSKNQIKKNKKMDKKGKRQQKKKNHIKASVDDNSGTVQDDGQEDDHEVDNNQSDEDVDKITNGIEAMELNGDMTVSIGSSEGEGKLSANRSPYGSQENVEQSPCLNGSQENLKQSSSPNGSQENIKQLSECARNPPCLNQNNLPKNQNNNRTNSLTRNSSEDPEASGHSKNSSATSSPQLNRNNSTGSNDWKARNGNSVSRHNSCGSDHGAPGSKITKDCDTEVDKELRLRTESMKPLAPLETTNVKAATLISSLWQFTAQEYLRDGNKFGCDECSTRKNPDAEDPEMVYTNASKQMMIYSPPAVLTLHIKRFQQVGFGLRKNSKIVEFPMELDIAPFCSSKCRGVSTGQQKVLYRLYGVVEHSGSLHGGHYTAYVKVRPHHDMHAKFMHDTGLDHEVSVEELEREASKSMADSAECGDLITDEVATGKWYYISDSNVQLSSETSVLRSQAYLLFYERIC